MLTCEHRSRATAIPADVEPVAAPEPRPDKPEQIPDAQVAAGVAVNRSPEEDVAGVTTRVLLPLLGNELRILKEIIENVGVEHELVRQLLAELVAIDALPILLVGRQMQLDLGGVESELAALLVRLHRPAAWHERVGVAVDEVLRRSCRGISVLPNERKQVSEDVSARSLFQVGWRPSVSLESVSVFVHLAD